MSLARGFRAGLAVMRAAVLCRVTAHELRALSNASFGNGRSTPNLWSAFEGHFSAALPAPRGVRGTSTVLGYGAHFIRWRISSIGGSEPSTASKRAIRMYLLDLLLRERQHLRRRERGRAPVTPAGNRLPRC
jgi:hypothetical protein